MKQRGLSAYGHYLATFAADGMDTYRFPSIDEDKGPYDVKVCERYSYMEMKFGLVGR